MTYPAEQVHIQTIYQSLRRKARIWLESSSAGFRLSLRIRNATGPHGYPEAPWHNAVLKTQEEADNAIRQVRKLGLPVMKDLPKNWDSLAALDLILRRTGKDARVFDAGGELYSMILQWLYLYGYRNLLAGNLAFQKPINKGPIVYLHSDITQTGFDGAVFDAITCLSVIEHGVSLRSYFREMARILKPGGVLITSTDYFETRVDTGGQRAYGVPIHVFDREEIIEAMEIAGEFGLTPLGPMELSSDEKVVSWRGRNQLRYTFVIFSLCKTANVQGM
jgi:SAM-dependent methyltransferase